MPDKRLIVATKQKLHQAQELLDGITLAGEEMTTAFLGQTRDQLVDVQAEIDDLLGLVINSLVGTL